MGEPIRVRVPGRVVRRGRPRLALEGIALHTWRARRFLPWRCARALWRVRRERRVVAAVHIRLRSGVQDRRGRPETVLYSLTDGAAGGYPTADVILERLATSTGFPISVAEYCWVSSAIHHHPPRCKRTDHV